MAGRVAAAAAAALVLLMRPAAAVADVGDYLGKPVARVVVLAGGRPTSDPRLLDLVETVAGQPLRVAAIRETVAHLFSLGLYEDVRVHAAPEGALVTVTYELVPLRTIQDVSFGGPSAPGVDTGRIRRLIAERFGDQPTPGRIPDIENLVLSQMKESGYLHATLTSTMGAERSGPQSVLVLALQPGARTRIGRIDVEGDPGLPIPQFLDRLRLTTGEPFEREALNARIDRYLDDRRSRGYFAVRVSYSPRFLDDDRTADLTVTITPGPHVSVVLAGDSFAGGRVEDLVPISREGSADEDVLEDATSRIEDLLRSQGYRDATATHTRQERAGELVITFTVRKGPLYRVGRIDVSGNNSVPLTELQQHLRMRPGQPFADAAIGAEQTLVEDVYHRAGFASVQVAIAVESEPAIGGGDVQVALRIRITENTRTMVDRVRIEGASAAESTLGAGLALRPGLPYYAGALAGDRDTIQLRLANLGFQAATVTAAPGLSADGRRADVLFTVREGQRISVDHVLIVGNERTRTATIQRELQFKAGEPLGVEQVNESQRRLTALGLFRRVRVTELAHGDDAKRDVLVSVEEAPVITVGYGGGVEAGQLLLTDANTQIATQHLEVAPRAFFEIGRRNLFGKNRSVNLFTRVSFGNLRSQTTTKGFGEYRVIGTYREPRVLGTTADAFLTGTLEQQIRSSFNFARRAFNAEAGRRITRSVSVSGNYQIQRTELFDERIDPKLVITIDRLFPQVRLSSFSASIVRDTRDDPTDPAQGRFLSANGQIAGRRIGSEIGFAKSYFVGQLFRVMPGTDRVVLAGSARLGLAAGFPRAAIDTGGAAEPSVPASERFFAGGDTTIRGFALDQVGRPDTIKNQLPTGGDGLIILNAEVRLPVLRSFGAVGFVDAGNVFARATEISLMELRSSVGFGVRYKSPIGPIRVDLGFKTRRELITADQRESLTALHITLGQAF